MAYKSKPSSHTPSKPKPQPTQRRRESTSPTQPAFTVNRRGLIGVLAALVIVTIGAAVSLVIYFTSHRVNPYAYQPHLINVTAGDLPAPPFIGWTQDFLGEPPEKLSPDDTITNVNDAECEPGGQRQQELAWLIMDNATNWSGTEMYNAAYNSHIRIDMSNAHVESNGLDYDVVDRWVQDCSFVQFDQEDRTVRVTYKELPVDMSVWDFDDGRAWVQTVAVTTPQGYQGSSSTITTLGNAPGVTLQAEMTFRGRLDDNAVDTMDLLWSAQATKAREVQAEKPGIPHTPIYEVDEGKDDSEDDSGSPEQEESDGS